MVLTSEDIFLGIVAWPTGSAGQVSTVVRGHASLGKKYCVISGMFCIYLKPLFADLGFSQNTLLFQVRIKHVKLL